MLLYSVFRIATNLENMENQENLGNLKNCQNLRENSGKFEFLWKRPGKLKENKKYVTRSPTKCIPSNFPFLRCSGKKFKMSRKSQGKLRENSGNLVFQKCGHPATVLIKYLRSTEFLHVIDLASMAPKIYYNSRII